MPPALLTDHFMNNAGKPAAASTASTVMAVTQAGSLVNAASGNESVIARRVDLR